MGPDGAGGLGVSCALGVRVRVRAHVGGETLGPSVAVVVKKRGTGIFVALVVDVVDDAVAAAIVTKGAVTVAADAVTKGALAKAEIVVGVPPIYLVPGAAGAADANIPAVGTDRHIHGTAW